MRKIGVYSLLLAILVNFNAVGQKPRSYSSSDILLRMKKLNVLGTALYVAAHPDDENTRMITFLANEMLLETAYLSLTRGDGGQNLIGPEIREQLGIIRTQELLAARRRDGGNQFFTRANDFGYSKNTEETQRIWNRDEVLKDAVWTYRKFKPDVIITRFPPDSRAGHGHHTTSAILGVEAFKISGDPSVYPEQLKYVEPWSPKRISMNTGRWWRTEISDEDPGIISIDIGSYNELLGDSYSEIAAVSRSQHKSQGFGSSGSRGEAIEYLEHLDGDKSENNYFEGIDLSWGRVEGGNDISNLVNKMVNDFDPLNPSASINELLEIRNEVSKLNDEFWKNRKLAAIDELLKACSGLYMGVVSSKASAIAGESLEFNVELVNRSNADLSIKSMTINGAQFEPLKPTNLENNQRFRETIPVSLSEDLEISNPYWLIKEGSLGMYNVEDQLLRGLPENPAALTAKIDIDFEGTNITYEVPVAYSWTSRVKGEQWRPFVIKPAALVELQDDVVIFSDDSPKKMAVLVTAGKDNLSGEVSIELPEGWKLEPESTSFELEKVDDTRSFQFLVTPPKNPSTATATATVTVGSSVFNRSIVEINYDHFPIQTLFPTANTKLVKLDIKKRGNTIGYFMGAGDDIPSSLEQIGYDVSMLQESDLNIENLSSMDAVIMGIRAVNTYPNLRRSKEALMEYVENGGTLIYQYNTTRRITWEDFSPYAINFTGGSSDSRVSVEEAEIRILKPDHVVLNTPNKITTADFQDWVQERGLYFPKTWDENFTAILSSNDPGEEPKDGGLIIAKHGKGYFVYTGYAWFRQLPAGVPGAYRLFANIISLGSDEVTTSSTSDLDR